MNDQTSEESLVLRRVARRSGYGALLGCVTGMILNPPFKGIGTTPSDVQGLVYWSWLMASGIGLVLGALAGLIGRQKGDADNSRGGSDGQS